MYTIVGLGNPGSEHTNTRHNTGRIIVAKLAEQHHIELKAQKKPDVLVGAGDVLTERVRLVLPDTFMNKSGAAVLKYIKSAGAGKSLILIYDEIDLPLGQVRVAFGSSSAGHNGVKSVERAIKTKNFIKIRVGVSKVARGKAKKQTGERDVVEYLLKNFSKAELEKIEGPIFERVSLALSTIFETGDPVMGMNAVNGLSIIK